MKDKINDISKSKFKKSDNFKRSQSASRLGQKAKI